MSPSAGLRDDGGDDIDICSCVVVLAVNGAARPTSVVVQVIPLDQLALSLSPPRPLVRVVWESMLLLSELVGSVIRRRLLLLLPLLLPGLGGRTCCDRLPIAADVATSPVLAGGLVGAGCSPCCVYARVWGWEMLEILQELKTNEIQPKTQHTRENPGNL